MSKLEALLDTCCGAGVLLAPVYVVYKFISYAFS
jgi:hypothetical protein